MILSLRFPSDSVFSPSSYFGDGFFVGDVYRADHLTSRNVKVHLKYILFGDSLEMDFCYSLISKKMEDSYEGTKSFF